MTVVLFSLHAAIALYFALRLAQLTFSTENESVWYFLFVLAMLIFNVAFTVQRFMEL